VISATTSFILASSRSVRSRWASRCFRFSSKIWLADAKTFFFQV